MIPGEVGKIDNIAIGDGPFVGLQDIPTSNVFPMVLERMFSVSL